MKMTRIRLVFPNRMLNKPNSHIKAKTTRKFSLTKFGLVWQMVRAITSANEKLCKIVQNGKRGSFYTIWAKKRPTSVWANLCINASCYSTSANMHGYCSAPIYYFIFLSLSSINSHLIISPLSFDLSLFFCPLNPFIFY